MKTGLIAAIAAVGSLTAFVQPASACPAGYEAVWIQGNMVCKLKTPKLPLKTKQGRELSKGGAGALKSR
jgi:hypothetical protein